MKLRFNEGMKTTATKNNFLLLSILATLAAAGVLGYLSMHYYDLKFGSAGGASVCNINEVMNCDAVAASKYSALFGIPIALWGFAVNVVLFYFLAVVRWNLVQDPEKTSRYALLLSSVTVIATVVMGLISTQMSNLCLFCMAAYVLSIFGFIGAYFGSTNVTIHNLVEDIKDIFVIERWVAGFIIFIPVLALGANIMYLESKGYSKVEKIVTEKVAHWQISPSQNFNPNVGLSLQKGSSEPVMTIVEFADFRCPHCKHAAPTLHAFIKSHPDVKLTFKPFPLDGTCNEGIQSGDGISCGLAAAVMCSEQLAQKGWEAHDFFFDTQEEIIAVHSLDKNLEALANKTALNINELKTCVKDPKTNAAIRAMAKEGLEAKIQGTPAIFVNGKLLVSGQLLPVLEGAYQALRK